MNLKASAQKKPWCIYIDLSGNRHLCRGGSVGRRRLVQSNTFHRQTALKFVCWYFSGRVWVRNVSRGVSNIPKPRLWMMWKQKHALFSCNGQTFSHSFVLCDVRLSKQNEITALHRRVLGLLAEVLLWTLGGGWESRVWGGLGGGCASRSSSCCQWSFGFLGAAARTPVSKTYFDAYFCIALWINSAKTHKISSEIYTAAWRQFLLLLAFTADNWDWIQVCWISRGVATFLSRSRLQRSLCRIYFSLLPGYFENVQRNGCENMSRFLWAGEGKNIFLDLNHNKNISAFFWWKRPRFRTR